MKCSSCLHCVLLPAAGTLAAIHLLLVGNVLLSLHSWRPATSL